MGKKCALAFIAVLAAVVIPTGYLACTTPEEHIPTQKILFQFSYTNWAWGYVNQGFFIDNSGEVRGYHVNESVLWNWANNSGYITEEALEANFNSATSVLTRISSQELYCRYLMIGSASKGTLSEGKNTACDAGAAVYLCYQWDASQDKYKQILLSMEGDWTQYNQNPTAISLTSWLKHIEASIDWSGF
jgi:hypothetical protein